MRATPVAAPPDDADLRWFFSESDAAIGFSSSFDPLCAIAQAGPSDGSSAGRSPDGKMVRIVGQSPSGAALPARKLRALSEAWAAVDASNRQVLWAAYARHRVHPQHKKKLGHWPAVVMMLEVVTAAYAETCARLEVAHRRRLERQGAARVTLEREVERTVDEDGNVSVRRIKTVAVSRGEATRPDVPSLLEWLTESVGPRIDQTALRCGVSATKPACCAVHDSEARVLAAWDEWDKARHAALRRHGITRREATPRTFTFRRDVE